MCEKNTGARKYVVSQLLYRDEEHERWKTLKIFDNIEEATNYVQGLSLAESYAVDEINGTQQLMSYKNRMKMLKDRGVDTNLLLTDWCVSCRFSERIMNREGMVACGTGCNGILPFDTFGNFLGRGSQPRIKPITMKVEGEVVMEYMPVPIGYEEEVGVQ